LAAALPLGLYTTAAASEEPPRVTLQFFFEPGCEECELVRLCILPLVSIRYGELVQIVPRDLTDATNRTALLEWVERTDAPMAKRVYVAVEPDVLLAGIPAMERDLNAAIDRALSTPALRQRTQPVSPPDVARRLARRFTVHEVVVAGLVDGINPCAIAALIFLVSVLTLARERAVNIFAVGLAYTAGAFATYTTIGFGLLHVLRGARHFPAIQAWMDAILLALLLVFAALSFVDAWRARRGQAGGMVMKLPDRLSAAVRRTVRGRLGPVVRLSSAFAAGCIVTAIETVCTGQIYAPTLAIVIADRGPASREAALLFLYNLMFVVPLLAVLILAWRGTTLPTLLQWSARHTAVAKTVMGLFFLALAVLLLALRTGR
jgi:hypothetical protein